MTALRYRAATVRYSHCTNYWPQVALLVASPTPAKQETFPKVLAPRRCGNSLRPPSRATEAGGRVLLIPTSDGSAAPLRTALHGRGTPALAPRRRSRPPVRRSVQQVPRPAWPQPVPLPAHRPPVPAGRLPRRGQRRLPERPERPV